MAIKWDFPIKRKQTCKIRVCAMCLEDEGHVEFTPKDTSYCKPCRCKRSKTNRLKRKNIVR
jgi:hypothetical protein